ncbi:MAG TPA: hypothetical protein VH044_14910 [Polyangiaceae bacterium]|jgi:serine/threonine protein kinase|nr:hypothetical protein [Polyangiaceae bacterium]
MSPPFKVAPGQTLEGRFLLLEQIGRGGMSTVYKAADLENAGQPVAVKVPLPQYSSGVGSWSMFQQIGDPRAPRELCPTISEQTEEIVLRALRRDPAERYPTAAAFKADLDEPSQVRVSGLARRLVQVTRWRKRARLARFVALTGVAPLALLVASFRLLWWWLERKR